MAKKSIAERIAQLEAQKKTLQARLGKQERAKDTRRKVLLGAPSSFIACKTISTSAPRSTNGCAASCPASSPVTTTRRCSPICSPHRRMNDPRHRPLPPA